MTPDDAQRRAARVLDPEQIKELLAKAEEEIRAANERIRLGERGYAAVVKLRDQVSALSHAVENQKNEIGRLRALNGERLPEGTGSTANISNGD